MNKVIIFGSALLFATTVAKASWVSGGSAKGSEKSFSSLASMVEERSVVLGSLRSTSEAKAVSLQGLTSPASGVASSKAISTKWKDAATGASLTEVNTDLAFAKNDQGDLPEAGTWAGAALVAVAVAGGWRSRRAKN